MKTLAAIGLLCLLAQDKVSLFAEPPTDTAWPVLGRANRPDGTVVKVSAVRVERRWDPAAGKFRELASPEFRISRSAEISSRSFRAALKPGSPGLYDVFVVEGEQRLHAERILLGRPMELAAATRKSVAKLMEIGDRATAALDDLEKILAGKLPGTAKDRDAFIKRIYSDELLLQELAVRSDLTGSIALLNDVCGHLRNAQVWQLAAGKSEEELNDAQGEKREVFLDPKLTFKGLHEIIDSAKAVLSCELALSAARTLDVWFSRAEEKPDRQLPKARDAASEALKTLLLAPVEDREARGVIEAAERAEASRIAEIRAALRDLAAKHLAVD